MGGGTWKSTDWDTFRKTSTKTSSGASKSRDQIFAKSVRDDFNPLNIKFRESCDSVDSPKSTPVIIALDVTGSMGMIPEALIKDGLGKLAKEILDRKPVTNPHIMFMAVGDDRFDEAPLQATQFEADIRIAEQLKDLWLEGHGAGNATEGYQLPWYFAARKTKIDSFDKRGEKGILFTMGDEGIPDSLLVKDAKRILGDDVQKSIPTRKILDMVSERYDVFHLVIQEGGHYQHSPKQVMDSWTPLLGERVIPVSDYTKVPEVIVSILQVIGGKPKHDVAASWSGNTAVVIRDAISGLTKGREGALTKTAGASGTSTSVWRPKP